MNTISNYSLDPFDSHLQKKDLLHLLRRCLFGIGHHEMHFFQNKSINQCLDILLTKSPFKVMLAQEDPDLVDPLVPKGKQWINAPYEGEDIDKKRRIYLRAWWAGQILNRDYSLTEKMVLFWHNHFVTETEIVKDARYSYQYVALLRQFALGNVKQLIFNGTTNNAMLVYLNGNANNKTAPNENYGRELLELFTLGKQNTPSYNEDDVKAAARILTGWKDDKQTIQVTFQPDLHDTTDKTFSSFFCNATIKGKKGMQGANETDELITLIFSKEETARFVCRNLYRWFVTSYIDDRTESEIIAPLAQILRTSNFEIKPVLRTLLGSKHFFDTALRGCIVKSPIDFFVGATWQFEIKLPPEPSNTHLCWIHYSYHLGGLGMLVGDPPSVAGWPAFYQAPKYHQWWINTYTLSFRMKIIETLTAPEGMNCNGPRINIDLVNFVRQFKNPENLNTFIDDCLELLCAVKISQPAKDKLKQILLRNKPDPTYWLETWNKLTNNPEDNNHRKIVNSILGIFIKEIIGMPEYQMI